MTNLHYFRFKAFTPTNSIYLLLALVCFNVEGDRWQTGEVSIDDDGHAEVG